jgi:gliding motility-associated-like protein
VTITDNETGQLVERSFSVGESDSITISPTITDDLSNDGSGEIILNPSGGVPPYTFNWDSGSTDENLSDLAVGLYFVTITDSEGCVFEFGPLPVTDGSLLVSVESSLSEFNGNGVSCFGSCDGFIDVQVFGGMPPYEIEWNDGEGFELIPLCAGEYAYTITDAAGDSEQGTVNLIEPEEIEVTTLNSGCASNGDGFVEFEANGGASPYEFSFNGTSFSTESRNENLAVGSYNVFVRDANGCEVMVPYEIRSCSEGECFQASPVITPNGDGRNDRFIIECAPDRNNQLQIFNRMGQLVFEQDNYLNQWEGTDNISGDIVPEGSYIWVLRIFSNGVEADVQKGTVTVLRNLR